MDKPTHLDLFSGIGGFSMAAQWAGFKTIGFSEIEPYACQTLSEKFPDIQNLGDIRSLRGIPCDLITGGFPCQPFSVAGKRRGAGDHRALWPEMRRVIEESRPRWVCGENVPGIIGMELDRVLSDLESLGYTCWPLVLPACAVDARHRRDRVWIVAHAERRESGERFDSQMQRRWTSQTEQAGMGCRNVADATSLGLQGERADRQQITEAHERAPIPLWGRGDCSMWEAEPGMGRVANGIPHRSHRLRGLGNAIVPQVAYQILKAIRTISDLPSQ